MGHNRPGCNRARQVELSARAVRFTPIQQAQQAVYIFFCLRKRIFPPFSCRAKLKGYGLGVSLNNLIQSPILHFKNNQAAFWRKKNEIWLFIFYVGRVPGKKRAVRAGNFMEKLVDFSLSNSCKYVNIAGKHCCHGLVALPD